MKTGLVGRLLGAFMQIAGHFSPAERAAAARTKDPDKALPRKGAWGAKNHPGRSIRFWENPGGRSFFGPTALPRREFSHVSRQACRAVLRAYQFKAVSDHNPLLTRRERRRIASLLARLEYRHMMSDDTNAVPDDIEVMYRNLTSEALSA